MADRLPAVPDDDLIVEGEIVDDEPPAPQRATGTALAIVTDRRAQFAARHAAYVGLGTGVFFKRLWESRSATRFDRWLRGASTCRLHLYFLSACQPAVNPKSKIREIGAVLSVVMEIKRLPVGRRNADGTRTTLSW